MKILLGILSLIAIMFLVMMAKNFKSPELGLVDGALKPLSNKPNGVSTLAVEASKKVDTISFVEDLKTTKELIKKACEAYGNSKIIKEEDNYMHLVFTTGTMKYNDDVEFYFDEKNNLVHYRSESRVGYSDMGLNMERYNEIMKHFNKLKEAN